jgi:hypothetical protein
VRPIRIRYGRSKINYWRLYPPRVNAIPNPRVFRRCYRWAAGLITPLLYVSVEWGAWQADEK